jgi:hypothetical protein
MIMSVPEAPTVTVAVFKTSEEINTALAAAPVAVAVADHVPFLAITPLEGAPNGVAPNAMVAKTASAAVLISSVPEAKRFPTEVAIELIAAVFNVNAIVSDFKVFGIESV